MKTYNPDKKLIIEIYSNDGSGANGYTVYHIVDGHKRKSMSRRADGKDFDWMTDKQTKDFERGGYRFSITASQAIDYFQYIW